MDQVDMAFSTIGLIGFTALIGMLLMFLGMAIHDYSTIKNAGPECYSNVTDILEVSEDNVLYETEDGKILSKSDKQIGEELFICKERLWI